MGKKWVLDILGSYGADVPEAIQAEVKRLNDLLVKHCLGPYDENSIRIGLAVRVEGRIGVPFTQTGIRTEPFAKDLICANIYIKKADWEVPLTTYRNFLWLNVTKAVWICVEKLKKKNISLDTDRLRRHLELVGAEFLGDATKSARPDAATTGEPIPVDVYPDDELYQLVIQYKIEGQGTMHDYDKRVKIEALLEQFLGEADLGNLDGGDIGSGTANIFCFVKPERKGTEAIIQTLRKHGYLDGAVIQETAKGEEKIVWPPHHAGELSYVRTSNT